MKRFRGEQGVAMVTVLLVAAALTVLATTAAFSTINELKAGTDDRKSAEALAYAEAGVDRLMRHMRTGNVTWAMLIEAGCENPAGVTVPAGIVGSGSFEATLKVYEPNPSSGNPADRFVPAACNSRATAPNDPQGQHFVITSKGSHPAAKRIVQQIVQVKPVGLPIGIFANQIEAGGSPNMVSISMFSESEIRGREKLGFTGTDPYYYFGDIFPEGVVGRSATEHVPAAAHAATNIWEKQNGTDPEFPGPAPQTTKNCIANINGTQGQSLWDTDGSPGTGPINSGCTGQTGHPVTSRFSTQAMDKIRPYVLDEEDHQALRDAAKENGLYCSIANGVGTCTLMRSPVSYQSVWQDSHVAPFFTAGVNNFVAYFDFQTGTPLTNEVKWHASVWGCNDIDPALTRSVVLVVRRGGLEVQDVQVNGALIMDGDFKYSGGPTINGTIISNGAFRINGNATFSMNPCWVENMPGPLLKATPSRWSEIDR